jgi:hypothetical protein
MDIMKGTSWSVIGYPPNNLPFMLLALDLVFPAEAVEIVRLSSRRRDVTKLLDIFNVTE